jgi:hypothetical protein
MRRKRKRRRKVGPATRVYNWHVNNAVCIPDLCTREMRKGPPICITKKNL